MVRYLWILCLLFTGCFKNHTSIPKQSISVGIDSEPLSLDPRKARDLNSSIVLKMLFEGLMRYSKEGNLEGGVAKSVQISEDQLTYTFQLRETNWSDGSDVTAGDFVFAWKTLLDPTFTTDVAYHLFPIKNGKKGEGRRASDRFFGSS